MGTANSEGGPEEFMRKVSLKGPSRPVPIVDENFADSDCDDFETESVGENGNLSDEGSNDINGHHPKTPALPATTFVFLPQKDIRKEGYLYKQGGVDQNQGWRKRWFTFNGSALKYYKSNKDSISLRIIPVAMMKSVAPVKEGQTGRRSAADLFAANRQFQFTLECRQRTFLFGTDTLDNCQQWQSSLMAAIIDYQKKHTEEFPVGGEMSLPDIKGYAKLNETKMKYVIVLKGDLFRYYYSEDDYTADSPVHELPMNLTSLKEINSTALQMDKFPDQRLVLHFDSDMEAMRWKTYLENAVANALGDDTVLEKVRTVEENRVCADCNASDPSWASVNLAVVLCPKCAGHHRGLGVSRSKVRSLRMDNIFKENKNIVELLCIIGNKRANEFWFKDPANSRVIDTETPEAIRKKHIQEKYAQKRFADLINSTEDLNKLLVAAVREEDLLNVMKILFSGADINFTCQGQKQSAAEIAASCENGALREFMEQNRNTDVGIQAEETVPDCNRKKYIHHQGYLEKAGPNLTGFLKRWCVLHYGRITYYNDDQGSNEKGCIDMSDVTSISVPVGKSRPHCFDISSKARGRIYRFSASDSDSQKEWISRIISVFSPVESTTENKCLMAGYFYYKTHLSMWSKIWLELSSNCIYFHSLELDSSMTEFELCKGVLCQQLNVGKHTELKIPNEDLRPLSKNYTIELLPPQTDRMIHVQGQILKDTKTLFSLLEMILCNELYEQVKITKEL